MPWDTNPSQRTLILVLCGAVFGSCIATDCNNTKITVRKPMLKYMVNGYLHVTWTSETSGVGNYSVNYCCHKGAGMISDCKHSCPNYAKISSCSLEKNLWRCKLRSVEYVDYRIYLSAEFQGCQIKSDVEVFTPKMAVAHPPALPFVNMISESNKLVVHWNKPLSKLARLYCYFATCHQMKDSKKIKQVYRREHKSLTFSMHFDSSPHAFTSYQCCVKVHLCSSTGLFSDVVCNQSRTPEEAPSKAPELLCGDQRKCPTVVKDNLRNVTIYWKLPDKSTWNGNPVKIDIAVHEAGQRNTTRKYVLNGTATQYVLRGLKRNVNYHVYLRLCTAGGCGTLSRQLLLPAEQIETDDTIVVFTPKVLGITFTISILGIVLVMFVCFLRRNRQSQTGSTLPIITPPIVDVTGPNWSGESVATSIGVNPNYNHLDCDYTNRLFNINPDTISLATNGSGCDTYSLDSSESFSSRPLLSAETPTRPAEHAGRPRVTVTYLPQRPGTVTSLKPDISYDEGVQFV